jgi:hypothetical protein
MADDISRLARLLRWCGMALVAGGVLMIVATLLHPSRETAMTIVASESRLVAAHVTYTLAWLLVLLGLPGLYTAQRGGMGRLGVDAFRGRSSTDQNSRRSLRGCRRVTRDHDGGPCSRS